MFQHFLYDFFSSWACNSAEKCHSRVKYATEGLLQGVSFFSVKFEEGTTGGRSFSTFDCNINGLTWPYIALVCRIYLNSTVNAMTFSTVRFLRRPSRVQIFKKSEVRSKLHRFL